jgi:hypothetical protein
LSSVREWLEKNNRIIMLIFFGVFVVFLRRACLVCEVRGARGL